MFKRILVPLDGSKQAEQAIPVAIRLARASHGSILLLRVVDARNEFGLYSVGSMLFLQQIIEKDCIDATAYLAEIAHTIGCEGIETHIAVFSGQVVPQILDVADVQDIEMIVLCSHGSTSFKRWTLGSVAHKVVHQSPLPVLLLHAQSEHAQVQATYPLRALVPLNGSPLAEAALLPMAQVVAAMSPSGTGELHLMRVVNIPFIDEEYGDGQDTALRYRQAAFQTAREYLQMTQAKLSRACTEMPNVHLTWSVEEGKDVAGTVLQMAEAGKGMGSDLIALTTHGQNSFQHWVLGSVTERVLSATTLPVLIIHAQKTNAGAHEQAAEKHPVHRKRHAEQKENAHVSTYSHSI